VAGLEVGRFHGIGPKTAERMNRLGIHTGADLRAQSLAFLQLHFGKSGAWYHAISRAEDDRPVRPDRVRKSVGSETTFFEDLSELAEIEARVLGQLEDVWAYCERTGTVGRTVTVKFKYSDFQIATRSRSSPVPYTERAAVERVCRELVREVFPLRRSIRLVGVAFSNLGQPEELAARQLALDLPDR